MGTQAAIAHLNATHRIEQGNDSVGFLAIEHHFDALLVELAQLNRIYLGLLAARDELPKGARRELGAVSSDALETMSACPFALFSMGAWLESDTECAVVRGSDPSVAEATDSSILSFALAAGFFAWHVLRTAPSAARALLGLSVAQSERVRALSLAEVHATIHGAVVFSIAPLPPRWSNNDYFWALLARSAKGGSSDAMSAVHLLGRQLLAADAMAGATDFVAQYARRTVRPLGSTTSKNLRALS